MNTTPTERIFISYKRKDTERVFAIKKCHWREMLD